MKIKLYEDFKYPYEDFTAVDMDLVKDLIEDGISDPKIIQKELDFRNLSLDTILQIMDTLKSKSIKESYNGFNSISLDEYYKCTSGISRSDYYQLTNYNEEKFNKENGEPFTKSEIVEIEKIIGDTEYSYLGYNCIIDKAKEADEVSIVISKMKDEWYYVEYIPPSYTIRPENSEYFKCDQFFGLLNLLKKIKLLKRKSKL